jgi:tRNA A37 threonylcarbamoyltransferase TsaD
MKECSFQPFANCSFTVICGRLNFLTIRAVPVPVYYPGPIYTTDNAAMIAAAAARRFDPDTAPDPELDAYAGLRLC